MTDVSLPNGMAVKCYQRHEVPLACLEIQSYFAGGIDLRPGDTLFDVGANIGLFSLAAYSHCRGNLRTFAFEPVAPIYELLRWNCENNAPGGAIHPLHIGLSSRPGTVNMSYYPRAPMISTAYPDHELDLRIIRDYIVSSIMHMKEAPFLLRCLRWLPGSLRSTLLGYGLTRTLVPTTVTCRMTTVSDVIKKYQVDRIDLLKIDVEKAEMDVLEGISDADWPKIRQLAVEVHDIDNRVDKTAALLRSAGLKYITIDQIPTLADSGIFVLFAKRNC